VADPRERNLLSAPLEWNWRAICVTALGTQTSPRDGRYSIEVGVHTRRVMLRVCGTDSSGRRAPMLAAFLWPLAVVIGWGIIFGFSVFFSRLGMRERDDETKKQIEDEAKTESESGWTPLLS
jgi:hypothetical protein